jgi:hypothetical protein
MDYDKALENAIQESDATDILTTIAQYILRKTFDPSLQCKHPVLRAAWRNYVSNQPSETLKILFDIIDEHDTFVHKFYRSEDFTFLVTGDLQRAFMISFLHNSEVAWILCVHERLIAMLSMLDIVMDVEAIECALSSVVTRLIGG